MTTFKITFIASSVLILGSMLGWATPASAGCDSHCQLDRQRLENDNQHVKIACMELELAFTKAGGQCHIGPYNSAQDCDDLSRQLAECRAKYR